jgi:hypothetical protein
MWSLSNKVKMPYYFRNRNGGYGAAEAENYISTGDDASLASLVTTNDAKGANDRTDTNTNNVTAHFHGDVTVLEDLFAKNMHVTGLYYTSDRNMKHDIQTLHTNIVRDLRPVSYVTNDTNKRTVGFVAQEVEELNTDLVSKTTSHSSLDYRALAVHTTHAVQELLKEKEEMHVEREKLWQALNTLKAQMNAGTCRAC